jgi:hypothetical protein
MVSKEFDMEELRSRIYQESCPQLFDADFYYPRPETVHIILFNPGTEYQGAHTIEYPKGSGSNVILAFTSFEACHKFGQDLKKHDFFDPTVSTDCTVFISLYYIYSRDAMRCDAMLPIEYVCLFGSLVSLRLVY